MDEGRRLLRYILPGTVCLLEFLVFASLLTPWWVTESAESLRSAPGNGLGEAVAALAAFGAIGFLLSVIHHAVYWGWPGDPGPNYVDTLKMLRHRYITLRNADDESQEIPDQAPILQDRRFAWVTVSGIWHQRLRVPGIESVNGRVDSLGDLAHSMGTSRVGAVCAAILALVVAGTRGTYSFEYWAGVRFAVMVTLCVLLLFVYHRAYKRISWFLVMMVEQTLTEVLTSEMEEARARMAVRVVVRGTNLNPLEPSASPPAQSDGAAGAAPVT